MRNQSLTLGVVGTSNKENEFRFPIHPAHFPRLEPALQSRVFVEEGYGSKFGVDQAYLTEHVAGIISREALFEHCDVTLLPKPTEADFCLFRDGQIHWGWPHCVQDPSITQVAIDKRMTFVAWEAMFSWKKGEVPEPQKDLTIHKAIEIRNGVTLNPKILNFQKRATEYPHPVLDK